MRQVLALAWTRALELVAEGELSLSPLEHNFHILRPLISTLISSLVLSCQLVMFREFQRLVQVLVLLCQLVMFREFEKLWRVQELAVEVVQWLYLFYFQ
jgi:hypothetical protein